METKKNNKILPFKIATNAITLGAGFYVGFRDGQKNPVDPATKYFLLAGPSVLNATYVIGLTYGLKKLTRWGIENIPADEFKEEYKEHLKKEGKEITESELESDIKFDNEFAYNPLTENYKGILKHVGKTTFRTGIGYAVGFGLGNILNQ